MGSDFPSAFCYRLVVPDVLLLLDVVGFVEDGAVWIYNGEVKMDDKTSKVIKEYLKECA